MSQQNPSFARSSGEDAIDLALQALTATNSVADPQPAVGEQVPGARSMSQPLAASSAGTEAPPAAEPASPGGGPLITQASALASVPFEAEVNPTPLSARAAVLLPSTPVSSASDGPVGGGNPDNGLSPPPRSATPSAVVPSQDAAAAAVNRPLTPPGSLDSGAAGAPSQTVSAASDYESEVTFISGVGSTGKVANPSFWSWNYDNPASYSSSTLDHKWGGTAIGTSGGTVTYWFDPASNWTASEESALTSGLALWSAEANIQFAQASSAAAASFTFKRGSDGSAYESNSVVASSVGSSTINNPTGTYISIDTSIGGFGPLGGSFDLYGGYTYDTLVHEEGHLIGLGHGGAYNGSVISSQQQYSAYDSRLWSIMSYIDPFDTTAKYYNSYPVQGTNWGTNAQGYYYEPTTPMPLDILAAQRLYGAPTSTPLSGNNVFGFNCNISGAIEPYFDFTINKTPIVTLFDTGTNNTLDISGFSKSAIINLNSGSFSSVDGLTNNIGIAVGTKIDTVVCGATGSILTGNGDGDTFEGKTATFNSDVITNFSFGDKLYITDASASSLTFSYANGVLSFSASPGGPTSSVTLGTLPSGQFQEKADASGTGVDLLLGTAVAPTISGTVAGQATKAEASVKPFSGVTVSDANPGATDTMTITLAGGGGTLRDGTGFSGLSATGSPGVYVLAAATAGALTAELQALVFTPAPGSITTFTLSDHSSAGTNATDSATSVVDTRTMPGAAIDTNVAFLNGRTATFTGTFSDPGSTITGVEVFDGSTDLGAARVRGDGTWTLANAHLGRGAHDISAVATDATGSVSQSMPAPFSLQTGIGGQPYTSDEEDVDAGGNLVGEVFTKRNGALYLSDVITNQANGDHLIDYTAGTYFDSQAFFYQEDLYDSSYNLKLDTLYNDDGSHSITGSQNGLRLKSIGSDTMTGGGARETFVFNPHFGDDVITDFIAGGGFHDVVSLSRHEFNSVAQVLNHTQTVDGNAVIHVTANDTITLQNVTEEQLRAHPSDFKFHA